jgi:hypothetical protein
LRAAAFVPPRRLFSLKDRDMLVLRTDHATGQSRLVKLGYAARRVAQFRTGRFETREVDDEVENALEQLRRGWVIRTGFASYQIYRDAEHHCPACGHVGLHDQMATSS